MFAFLLFQFTQISLAKDLDETPIAIGLNTWYSDIPTISLRYSLPVQSSDPSIGGANIEQWQIQAEILAGFSSTPSDRSKSIIGGRLLSAVYVEDNLNLLVGAGAGFGLVNKTPIVQLQPSMEAQFFLFGLDYLSFSSGVGLNLTLGAGENSAATTGQILGGFHYWF